MLILSRGPAQEICVFNEKQEHIITIKYLGQNDWDKARLLIHGFDNSPASNYIIHRREIAEKESLPIKDLPPKRER